MWVDRKEHHRARIQTTVSNCFAMSPAVLFRPTFHDAADMER